MRQLCKHFGHKVDTSFDDDSGCIQFEFGRCELRAADGELQLTVSAPARRRGPRPHATRDRLTPRAVRQARRAQRHLGLIGARR
jgi:hypothetical protein